MPDDAGQGGTPASGGTPEQPNDAAKNANTQQPPEGGTPEGDDGKSGSADDTAALRKAIREEREARRAAETRLRAIEEKDLPEAEKAQRRVADLEEENKRLAAQLVQRDIDAEIAKASAKIGIVDTEVVAVLLRENDAIDFDSEGRPINVEAAIKDIVKQKPYLARGATAGADAGAGTRSGASPGMGMNDIIRRAAGRTG